MVNNISQSNTLTTGGGVITLSPDRAESLLILTGGGVLTGSWSITYSGTPSIGQGIYVLYQASLTLGVNAVTILGYSLSQAEAYNLGLFYCVWNGYAFDVVDLQSNSGTGFIDGSKITDNTIAGTKLLVSSVTNDKLAAIARASVKIGLTGNVAGDVAPSVAGQILQFNGTDTVFNTVSGDASISSSGAITINDNAISNDKLASMTRRTVKVGGAGNEATDLAVGDGQILLGSTTDIVAVTPTGDVAITDTGVTTIQPSVVDESKITYIKDSSNVYRGVVSKCIIENGELRAYLDGTTRNVIAVNANDIILNARLTVTTASGSGTDRITVGVDSNVRSAGAITDGFLTAVTSDTPGIYASTSASGFATYVGSLGQVGYQKADSSGFLTVTSNVNLTASTVVCTLVVTILSK